VDLADRYTITSNRESGFGRYDVVLEPVKDNGRDDAVIMEFKVRRPQKFMQNAYGNTGLRLRKKRAHRVAVWLDARGDKTENGGKNYGISGIRKQIRTNAVPQMRQERVKTSSPFIRIVAQFWGYRKL